MSFILPFGFEPFVPTCIRKTPSVNFMCTVPLLIQVGKRHGATWRPVA